MAYVLLSLLFDELIQVLEAIHNLTTANHGMHDPSLTSHGENQCLELRSKFPHHDSVNLLVCSPLRRTIQTTMLAFEPEISRGVQFIALADFQETSDLPCDTGSDLNILKEEFKDKHVHLCMLPEDWNSKKGKWAPHQDAIAARCREARKWLKARDEEVIVVVTHGGLLHYLTEDWTGSLKLQGNNATRFLRRMKKKIFPSSAHKPNCTGTGWENTEFRSYRFVDGDDDNASMEEIDESRQRRGNKDKPLTTEEKIQLRETATKEWESQGFEKTSKV
ncbi:MAG: hypothetical protein Q9166_000134 [cf. Caloplaca sp. 2 TL-2023]